MTSKQKKIVLYGSAGVALLYLIYRYMSGGSTAAQQAGPYTTMPGVGATGSDYAALSGQEQSDAAALQQQNSQLLAQEQSDVQALTSQFQQSASDLQAQEQQDYATAQSDLQSSIQDAIQQAIQGAQNAIAPNLAATEQEIAALAAGQQKLNRALTHQQHTRKHRTAGRSRHGGSPKRNAPKHGGGGTATRRSNHHAQTRHRPKPQKHHGGR